MLCPACSRLLNKIMVTTREEGRFQVDHCGYCGGTWFDPYEINRIPFHEVVNLANLTVTAKSKETTKTRQLCPNDNLPLEKFQGEAVPAKVNLLWCKKCLGLWATAKDLVEFKKHQEETVSAYDEGNKFFPSMSVVLIPALTFVFLLALTFSTISSLQHSREQRIFAESQITGLNIYRADAMGPVVLSFNTAIPVKSTLFYGESTFEMDELVIQNIPTTTHNVIIPDINPDKQYIYKIRLTDIDGRTFTTDLRPIALDKQIQTLHY